MLRISVTDRCNLRCRYCMPEEGVRFEPRENLLTVDSIARIADVAWDIGVRHFKITGGEPTVRSDLSEIVRVIRDLGPSDLSLTSNAIHLHRLAGPLKEAGLDRVTLSVDSLQKDRYARITGGGRIDLFHRGLEAAAETFGRLKLNVVVMRGVNEDELVDFARLAMERDWTVRFIEFMPLGSSSLTDGDPADVLVTAEEMVEMIEAEIGPLVSLDSSRDPGVGPARLLACPGGRGRIGLIHAMSRPFCESCNRLRLTADGVLRSCLFDGGEIDLRPLLDEGPEVIRDAFARCTALKPEVHGSRGDRAMSSIGG